MADALSVALPVMPQAVALQLDAITRQLLALRESVESILLQTAALRAQYAPATPRATPSPDPNRERSAPSPPRAREVRVYGGAPRSRSGDGVPSLGSSLGTSALREAIGIPDDAIGSTVVPPADEARSSDAS